MFEQKEFVIKEILENKDIVSIFPFYIFDDPFRKLLIKLSKSDGKVLSLYNRLKIGESLGNELVEELINSNILYLVNSREDSLKAYPKQKIKKEFKSYSIESKIYFTKPFYKFWFSFIEEYRYNNNFYNNVIGSYNKWGYKLISLIFEQLSIELLKDSFFNIDKLTEVGSYWDFYSEYDIYCKTASGKYILGECKYKNRPITNAELNKLKIKAINSNLKVDYYALFSKNGFSKELKRSKDNNLLFFDLSDFDKIIF